MKKTFIFIFQFILLFSINIKNVYANISLNYKELYLGIDDSIQLNITGDNTTNINWSTSDPNVATIINGRVFGASIGTAYISASNELYTATCKVNIISNYVPVSGISLKETSGTIIINDTKKIEATLKPNNASNKVISYSSSDSSIATVDSSGTITGKKSGTAYITITAESKTASYKITVSKTIDLKSISISPNTLTLNENDTKKLTVSFSPSNASNKEVSWKSSDTNIATVSNDGTITANSSGTATITATSIEGGHTATARVTVNAVDKSLKGISLNKNELSLKVGATEELAVSFNPTNAKNKNITWTSSNPEVATIKDGKVTAIKPGKVEIKAVSKEGNYEAICKVIVLSEPIESISFINETENIPVGSNIELKTISIPENTVINDPIWTSSDETVAVVDENGMLTALQEGTTTITISDKDGKVSASTTIIVGETTVEEPIIEPLTITVDNYDLMFNPDIKHYTLKIGNEKKLNINVNRNSDIVSINGNQDLKNDSTITITVYNPEKVTYVINIKKKSSPIALFAVIIIAIAGINVYIFSKKGKSK